MDAVWVRDVYSRVYLDPAQLCRTHLRVRRRQRGQQSSAIVEASFRRDVCEQCSLSFCYVLYFEMGIFCLFSENLKHFGRFRITRIHFPCWVSALRVFYLRLLFLRCWHCSFISGRYYRCYWMVAVAISVTLVHFNPQFK